MLLGERHARIKICAIRSQIGIGRGEFGAQVVLHQVVGEEVAALTGEQPRDGVREIIVRLDSNIGTDQAVRNEVEQVRDLERAREVLRASIANGAHQAQKQAIEFVHLEISVFTA